MSQKFETKPIGAGVSPALLVVDASNGFTDPNSPLGARFDAEMLEINKLLMHARSRKWPCFFSTVVYHNEKQASVFRKKIPALNSLTPDSNLVKLDSRISLNENDTLFEKQYASCFFGTELSSQLKAANTDTLIVTGFTTSGCVRASVVDALQHDLKVLVVKDAVGDRDQHAHEANLHDMGTKYADLANSNLILNM